MARPREFDTGAALDAAMNVFWLKGYAGASLNDLLDAMQIARGSLYKAFDDKRSIYLATLDRYDRSVLEAGVTMLRASVTDDGVKRIECMLNTAADAVAQRGDRRGCFLCNAAVEMAPVDHEIGTKVRAMLARLESAIETALDQSNAVRDWTSQRRREAAGALASGYMGLQVWAKAGFAATELRKIIRTTLVAHDLVAAH